MLLSVFLVLARTMKVLELTRTVPRAPDAAMAAGDDDHGDALDRREMSPLARRAAATRRRIEAARAAAAATAPRSPTNLSSTATGNTSRMFGAPTQHHPPSSLAAREDRKSGSPYNVGRVASSSVGGSNLATPSGIAARNRADVRAHARKIRVCVPMTAEWFKCDEHIRALAEAAEREDRNPSVAGSNPRTATNPSLWDVDDGRQVGDPLTGHAGTVSSAALHPDGTTLASAGWDGTVHVWDPGSPDAPAVVLAGHAGRVDDVAWSPAGLLASAGQDGTVRFWDVSTGSPADPSLDHAGAEVFGVAFSPDGS